MYENNFGFDISNYYYRIFVAVVHSLYMVVGMADGGRKTSGKKNKQREFVKVSKRVYA